MLTEEEVELFKSSANDLRKGSKDLFDKICVILESPYLKVYCALKVQLLAYATELEISPFTIRGNDEIGKFGELDIEDTSKIIEVLAGVARQRAETSLKIAKEMKDLAFDVEEIGKKLTHKETREAAIKVVGRAEELRNKMLEELNNGKKK